MDFNIKQGELNKNTNNKEYLEVQLKELDLEFNSLYERMNKRRKELNDLEQETKKEVEKHQK